ncbi:hypothetical protein FSP39_017669 [Pinctada imbricata]|uniref:CCHC-type domain-containing protein n=1 Tax=Pinctada imbricata TaxID=66713 RepID=A0AA89BM81_PINIB|nr:hypothetical protein FSP39_017669 [Pinctada imbricata]
MSELKQDCPFASDLFLDLIVKFQKADFVDPKELNFFKEGEGLETLSCETLEQNLEKSFSIDIEKVAAVTKKKLTQRDLVTLSHIAIEMANQQTTSKKKKTKDPTPSPAKKAKSDEASSRELKEQIDELRLMMNTDSVAHALRDVKEYAARSSELNVDTLQLKLMHLDDIGRRTSHEDKDLFSSVLQRFLCHKSNPKIGFLVTSLLCTPAESKLYEKEQKFLKLHGKVESSSDKSKESTNLVQLPDATTSMMQFLQTMMATPQFRPPFSYPRPFSPRKPSFTPRRPGPSYSGCHKCGDMSHFKVDCPKK